MIKYDGTLAACLQKRKTIYYLCVYDFLDFGEIPEDHRPMAQYPLPHLPLGSISLHSG